MLALLANLNRQKEERSKNVGDTAWIKLVDDIFKDLYYERMDAGIKFMHDEIQNKPTMFDNDFRNIQNYVEVKLKAEIKRKKEEDALIAPNYNKL